MMKSRNRLSRSWVVVMAFALAMPAAVVWSGLPSIALAACPDDDLFTSEFRLEDCHFLTIGENPYFILRPGYQLVLEGEEDGDVIRAEITVLEQTEEINLRSESLGLISTRVVEEREYVNRVLVEISRNFFAICDVTNAAYYFGEDVGVCDLEETGGFDPENPGECLDGSEPDDEGAWRAGGRNRPGLIMPGTFLLGSRYFQEVAPGEAMDRGENVAMGLRVRTPAGRFDDCVEVVDTNPLEEPPVCLPDEGDVKIYCPGVGQVIDEELELVEFGDVDLEDAGDFVLTARAFIDYRCDTFFQNGVDRPLPDVPVTLTFPEGAAVTRHTGAAGHAYFHGFDVNEDGVMVSSELPTTYGSYPLGACVNSPTSRQLEPEDFGLFKSRFVQFGAELLP